jgi:predicted small lipoprotein YifL
MKKLIALLLALAMVLSMAACGTKTPAETNAPETQAPETTAPAVEVPASALEILEKVWALFGDDEKFPVMGGDYEVMASDAPGAVNVANPDFMVGTLLVPEAEAAKVTEAASLVHGMMLNNFTCGVFRVSGDAAAFADAMYGRISTNPWMCGMPEKMVIAVVGGEYVLAMFGVNDAVNPFETKLAEAHPEAVIAYNEAIAG